MFGSTEGWTAGAAIFSGRPDPEWEVVAEAAELIVSRWNAAPRAPVLAREPPPLGYRGCWLRAPDGREWRAGRGVVAFGGESRADVDGAIENSILATAPECVLDVNELSSG